MQAPRESDLVSSEDVSKAASSNGGSMDEISSFVAKKVGGRERKIRRKVCMNNDVPYCIGILRSSHVSVTTL